MSRTVNRVSLLGLFLIAFGALILMKKFHVLSFHTSEVIWPLVALLGLFVTGRGLVDRRKGKIIGGTVLFLYSIFFLVRSMDRYMVPIDMIVPASFLIFGIVFLMLFVNRPSDWYHLIPALLLLTVGASIMMTEYGYWYGWEIRDALRTWWPAALVLFGLGMILRHRGPKRAAAVNGHDAAAPAVSPSNPASTAEPPSPPPSDPIG